MLDARSPDAPDFALRILDLSLEIDGNLVRQRDSVQAVETGEVFRRNMLFECRIQEGIIGCGQPIEGEGGSGGLGRYTLSGDTLRFGMEEVGFAVTLLRVPSARTDDR
jgi:hypothetical protein